MSPPRRLATMQVDVDGAWVLLQFLGHRAALDADPVFETGLPRMLELLDRYRIHATFFVNTADLGCGWKRAWLERVLRAGHELASHGVDHPYFSQLSLAEKTRQIAESAAQLAAFSGQAPRGFRAPGYDLDGEGLSLLREHGYRYDCSAFPTSVSPLLQLSQRMLTGKAQTAYPWLDQLRAPVRPYHPGSQSVYRNGAAAGLLEIPVTVMPGLRFPLTFSYGALAGGWYLRWGIRWALAQGGTVNFLFHLVDVADPIRDARLRRVPGLRMPLERRLALAEDVMRWLTEQATVMPTAELCERLTALEAAA